MSKFEQLPLQINGRPKQHPIQILTPDRADHPFYEWMGEWHVRNCLDFFNFQHSQIGLPLMEPIQRIMIRAEILREAVTVNRSTKHPTTRNAIHNAAVNTKPNDPPRTLVHHY